MNHHLQQALLHILRQDFEPPQSHPHPHQKIDGQHRFKNHREFHSPSLTAFLINCKPQTFARPIKLPTPATVISSH